MEKPCRLQSMGSHRVGHDCSDLAAAAAADVFLALSCFFDDPTDVGNLISSSSAFSKSSLNIWKFIVHALLKPDLENFELYFASVWDECNCEHSLELPFFGIGMKFDLFQSCGRWVFQICWHIECNTFTASSFRIWFTYKQYYMVFVFLTSLIMVISRFIHVVASDLISLFLILMCVYVRVCICVCIHTYICVTSSSFVCQWTFRLLLWLDCRN